MTDLERFTREMTCTFELLRKAVRDLPAPLVTRDRPSGHWRDHMYPVEGEGDLGGGSGWKLIELGNGKQWLTDGIDGINPESIPIMLGAINGALSAIRYAKAHPEETVTRILVGTEVEGALALAIERTKRQ
jgi:hypothetical protein